MISDPHTKGPDIGGEVRWAGIAVRIVKEDGIADQGPGIPGKGPVRNGVMYIGGIHIINILRIIVSVQDAHHTVELAFLLDNVADISSIADPGEFPDGNVGAVHNDGCNRRHAVFPFSAGFALDQPGKQFSVVKWHPFTHLRSVSAIDGKILFSIADGLTDMRYQFIICLYGVACHNGG